MFFFSNLDSRIWMLSFAYTTFPWISTSLRKDLVDTMTWCSFARDARDVLNSKGLNPMRILSFFIDKDPSWTNPLPLVCTYRSVFSHLPVLLRNCFLFHDAFHSESTLAYTYTILSSPLDIFTSIYKAGLFTISLSFQSILTLSDISFAIFCDLCSPFKSLWVLYSIHPWVHRI